MIVSNICYMTVSNIYYMTDSHIAVIRMNDILIVTDPYAYTDAYGEAQKRLLWIALHIPMSCNIMNTITMIDELMPAWASAGQSRLDCSRALAQYLAAEYPIHCRTLRY